jgi:hypothetical protein
MREGAEKPGVALLQAPRRTCAALWMILALVACNGSWSDRVREQVHRSIAVGAAPLVRVDNIAGAVRVEAWDRPIVDVDATKYGYDTQELRSVDVVVTREESGASIVTKYTGGVHGGGVRYRIFVPADASLHIGNVAGTVDLAGVRGNVAVDTQAGMITANVGVVDGDRSIDLRATTGAIELTIARGSSVRVEAYSTVGAFDSDIPGISQQRQNLVGSKGGGTIGSGSASIRLETTTGAITLRQRL